jgi:hypothetical protein
MKSAWMVLLMFAGYFGAHAASALPGFDFTRSADRQGWHAANHISSLRADPEGFLVQISGPDPYFMGPPRDYPAKQPLWLVLRLKSEQGGLGQVFYFKGAASEQNSVRFHVPAGEWFEARLRIPPLGDGYRIRIDPPGDRGTCIVSSIRFEERISVQAPQWPVPRVPELSSDAPRIESGALRLVHAPTVFGGFGLDVDGRRMAVGHSRAMAGYLTGKETRWISFNASESKISLEHISREQSGETVAGLKISSVSTDPDGARWRFETQFFPGRVSNTIDVESRVTIDREREVVYLPMLKLFPGLGSFGTNKAQGIFAGLEYLENEPSSSEADLAGPASQRQVPDQTKITFPLMAVAAEGRYVGLIWEMQPRISAVFDSPDRLFGSEAHLMGLLFPGSDGIIRDESNLLPYGGERIAANQPLIVRATLVGGRGESVVPAVQDYVRLRGLPPVPDPGYSPVDFYRLAAHGWLDSAAREGNRYRHAVWPGFNAQPAADAALYMDRLADSVNDAALARRLREAAGEALELVPPHASLFSTIGHIRYPVAPLVYGAVAENANHARAHARNLLKRFRPDGAIHYQASPNGVDYGKTHFAPDANGLTAQVVASLLEAAVFSGDRELIGQGLRVLRALDKFRNTVPRGAQTWEIALHTPDILASAHLVSAYTLGYELTGDRDFLEQARYWGWTGVPFVYLHPPAEPFGIYNTIPVLGATGWVAPIWIGLPVQWCGLVYAEALYRLARHDADGPWKTVADGIVVGGIQHTWPMEDAQRKGLLPDFLILQSQQRDGPAINPGTVLAGALRFYDSMPLHDFYAFREAGLLVHAPGKIKPDGSSADAVQFDVAGWPAKPYKVLINGVSKAPRVSINGAPVNLAGEHQFDSEAQRLILQLEGSARVEIRKQP